MSEQQYEADYKKGFNEGYIIAQHLPELSDQLATIDNAAPRIEGIKHGGQQFILEQTKERRPAWLKPHDRQQPPPSPSKNKDKEPDR